MGELSVKVSVNLLESPLVKYSCLSELLMKTFHTPRKPLEELNSSSQVDKRSSSPESSDSPTLSSLISIDYKRKERLSQTVSTLKLLAITDSLTDFQCSDIEAIIARQHSLTN